MTHQRDTFIPGQASESPQDHSFSWFDDQQMFREPEQTHDAKQKPDPGYVLPPVPDVGWDPLPSSRGTVAVCEPEDGGEARKERTGDLRACPYVAPTVAELIGQPGDHLQIGHVLVEHFDRGAVPVTVDLEQHRLG